MAADYEDQAVVMPLSRRLPPLVLALLGTLCLSCAHAPRCRCQPPSDTTPETHVFRIRLEDPEPQPDTLFLNGDTAFVYPWST